MKKRALLYNPYLDVLGGGEKHVLSIMGVLAEHGYAIDIAWDDKSILEKLQTQLRCNVTNFSIIPNFINTNDRSLRLQKTSNYDVFVYVTNGSYFQSNAQRNVIFSMYPQKNLYNLYPTNWLKLRNFGIITNGEFTAEKVDMWLHRKSFVVYPYIDQAFFAEGQGKDLLILSVGRIFKHLHSKRQDVLINAFKKLKSENQEFTRFKLMIIGGLKDEDTSYFQELQKSAEGSPDIEFHTNISYEDLVGYYHSALIYWHAAGFGYDEDKNPENVEHVGISPLEAMASRCLTLCYDAGGPKRYIQNGKTGYTYTSIDDLIQKTIRGYAQINKDEGLVDEARKYVSTHFSYPVFKNRVEQFFHL
ncbi:hypothetical protein A3B02_01905 [Candidatus Roizmanbacteria bacterium RIFCSPLOWO2_01_FULL_42_14]|uniref:Glycosyl transferase family 1 domain-containing protein n=4 Tax=Candidatus Roizmaniibacteriota TaxID=1752723 RepID=A0A1F7JUV1_9BACT|nr:MAG: hypothetical protein A3D08_02430 [Candidatus Roizmanbacteria bacterium RIFCSPHIGHO2_02_FULL_43_11]OGK38379.1 MAG: hypothetical protein A3F32_00155 [Candidatus Roizmanbacteria bacterium RIFCSPHIGHO2_12_FULL_42_10]OGK52474.1 MAG: hypothetical protein A3B02_01905 [Candidatus Roizmanbacteria bacterium RIFCSPLOWO2_01_FULL_42_14]OGK59401.1 MAG: hypothetical protein A3I56_01865 [Candidatus Roizmanbacteria bacterium RIFCSPLOWO2_02_FULL_43_10]